MELILIRHALPIRMESEDGQAVDPGLCEDGQRQAQALAAWWQGRALDRLYTSPLLRARQTAQALSGALGLEAVVEDRVAEFDREASAYIPLEELKRTDYPAWKAFVQGDFAMATDLATFRRHVIDSLEEIIADNPGRRVAVVCHGGVINVFASNVLGFEPRLFFDPFYTSMNRFLAAGTGERNIRSLNETPHLDRHGESPA